MVQAHPRENMEVPIPADAVHGFARHFEKLMYQAVLAATKNSFNKMKRRLGSRSSGGFLFVERPFFDVDVELAIPNVVMKPSLEEIQSAINETAKKVLRCAKEIGMWGERGESSFYELLAKDKEIVKVVLLLTGSIEGTKLQVLEYINTFGKYDFLWKQDMQDEYKKFMSLNPSLEAFEAELKKYMAIEKEIAQIPPVHNIGALSLETAPMKLSLKQEAGAWKAQFAENLHNQGNQDLRDIFAYMKDASLKLSRKVADLEDVRNHMTVLKEVRERESEIDNVMVPIEEIYALLGRYEVKVAKEETDMVGDLRYSWRKLRKLSTDVSDNLSQLQVGFKRELIKEVRHFIVDVQSFREEFDNNGPMVPGLDPMEAVDRLKKFQQLFDVRKRKWTNYSSGEELFGLTVTEYPELEKTEKEIQMLDRLYSLFVTVITTINSYGEFFWVDVVPQIEEMTETVMAFQAQCKRLPKSLRGWPAFRDLKKKIDDFLEILPLIQALCNKSMRPRHWEAVMTVTGKEFNLSDDVFKLQHLLDADLLAHFDDLEELTSAAVKEEQVEVKLAAVAEDWADQIFAFGNYKHRGQVILQPAETGEIVEKLEDTQMALGSMATNRYSAPFREEVQEWIVKLSTVSEIIEMWLVVQNMWCYMEAVFSGGDIVKQLPQEAKRFQNIDKNYMKVVTNAIEVRSCSALTLRNVLAAPSAPSRPSPAPRCQALSPASAQPTNGGKEAWGGRPQAHPNRTLAQPLNQRAPYAKGHWF